MTTRGNSADKIDSPGIDSPGTVATEYADATNLEYRNRMYRELLVGESADDVLLRLIVDLAPGRVLEVGCGTGELAETLGARGLSVTAIDQSAHMVSLARARSVDAHVADVQDLPFRDAEFDLCVAPWMLFHVLDIDQALREMKRVVAPGGVVIAATFGDDCYGEVYDLVRVPKGARQWKFADTSGMDALQKHFPHVERILVPGRNYFNNSSEVKAYLASTISWKRFADRVPELDEPLVADASQVIFVARA